MRGRFYQTILFIGVGLGVGAAGGYAFDSTLRGAVSALFMTAILAVLEISLSFDNAVANATVLKDMSPLWQRRFMTWGFWTAVLGMRIVFPLVVVSFAGGIAPWTALNLAIFEPDTYAEVMESAHVALAGFGATFLLLVALRFFFDSAKNTHWLVSVERRLAQLGQIKAIGLALALGLLYLLTFFLPGPHEQLQLLHSGSLGIIVFVVVEGVSSLLASLETERADLGRFIYLELLDASFSFDGVIGAFALTSNLLIIAAGLGIGAFFVRSLTIFLVRRKALEQFIFLEHGAFYAIGLLAALMLLDLFVNVPDVITGVVGAVVIGLSLLASVRHARKFTKKSRSNG